MLLIESTSSWIEFTLLSTSLKLTPSDVVKSFAVAPTLLRTNPSFPFSSTITKSPLSSTAIGLFTKLLKLILLSLTETSVIFPLFCFTLTKTPCVEPFPLTDVVKALNFPLISVSNSVTSLKSALSESLWLPAVTSFTYKPVESNFKPILPWLSLIIRLLPSSLIISLIESTSSWIEFTLLSTSLKLTSSEVVKSFAVAPAPLRTKAL